MERRTDIRKVPMRSGGGLSAIEFLGIKILADTLTVSSKTSGSPNLTNFT